MTDQLALPFPRDPAFRAADLLPNPAQDAARAWLDRTAEWPMRRLVLWGEAGCGKSHLLHAWAETAGAPVLQTPPDTWPGTPLAIDDYDQIQDEEALLHAINAAHETGHPVLLAGRLPPGRLPTTLPDLASRLRAATAVEVAAPPDDLLDPLLTAMLADRQLRLPSGLAPWLLARLPRHPAALRDALDRLEHLAADEGRTLTKRHAIEALGPQLAETP